MMKAVIVEDEKAAVRNLTAIINQIDNTIDIIATLDSITDSIDWFTIHAKAADLVFMDINLADGSAFEIFDHVQITAPVIFTTAYDEHALRAFKVNSIDYLLKPIAEQDVRQALAKLQRLTTDHTTTTDGDQLRHLVELLSPKRYTTHFLVPQHNDKFFPLTVGSISYFYINEGTVRAVTINSQTYILPQTLDEIADMVDPANFFRINRQYLISRDSVLDIGLWFNNRLSINLKIPTSDKILVSKVRVSDFKAWFAGQAH